MAMQNLGQNPMQQEQPLKTSQSNAVNDTSWHNTSNENPTDVRPPITCSAMSGNIDNISNNNNNNNNNVDNDTSPKIPRSDATLTGPHRTLNRPPQHQPTPPQTQSQTHHGIFSPQLAASEFFASRVDQIIRTTLHDPPPYTPPSSKNSNIPTNNPNTNISGTSNSTSSSSMPSPSSSLIFNQACNAMAPISSTSSDATGIPPNSSVGPASTIASPLAMGYGLTPTLGSTSDMSTNNGANSNLPSRGASAHSSASHSALAAAAALQSLNQSHFQRSQQQLAAHTQQAPFLNAAPPLTTKPPSNTSGTPVPQAAHGNSSSTSNHMPKMCMTTSVASAPDHNRLSAFSNDRPDNPGEFALRIQSNNASNTINNSNNKIPPHTSTLSHLPPNWQDHATHLNGSVPRMISAHSGGNTTLPPFAAPSNPYALISAHIPMGSNSSNSTMMSQDGDTLSRLNALRNANPSQANDEKNGIPNFSIPMMRSAGAPSSVDLMRIQQTTPGTDRKFAPSIPNQDVRPRITEPEKQAIFSYNLLSPFIPGSNRCKDIVHLDDDMRKSILNLSFYTKYEHIAAGILNNTILVPNFSIIDYLRQSKFPLPELERIEALNRKLNMSDYSSLMELVRQKPLFPMTSKVAGIEVDRPQYGELGQIGNVPNLGFSHENSLCNHAGPYIRNNPLMSSPNRNDLATLQGIEKSCRSSQSPSDITRSQMGSIVNHSKFSGAQNQISGIHNPPHSSPLGINHFGPSPYSSNLQRNNQQQTSPQAHRHSPLQQPIGMCTTVRPPRSHSTIGGLNIGLLNSSFNPVPARQPPAAHQSSSRPNLSALASEFLPPNAHSSTAPVTAHMSSKTPQTPRLSENLVTMQQSPTKTHPPVNGSYGKAPGSRELSHSNQPDLSNLNGRQDLDSIHGMPTQTLLSLRPQEMNNRELATKRSSTPQYTTPSVPNIGPTGSMISMDVSRQVMIQNNYGSQLQVSPHMNSQSNNPLGLSSVSGFRSSTIPNSNLLTQFNQTMPLPGNSIDIQRQNLDSLNKVTGINSSNSTLVESQPNHYNSLMSAYQQQQILLSNKLIDNGPGALPPSNISNRPNQSPSQRVALGEPISVDTAQGRQLVQTNSPKSNNQRSIITGTASVGAKKTKKAKISPTVPTHLPSNKGSCSDSKQSGDKLVTADQHEVLKQASLDASDGTTTTDSQMRTLDELQGSAAAVEPDSARGVHASIHPQQGNNATFTNTKSANLSSASSLPNISEQSFSSGEKSFDESGLLDSEAKLFNCTNETSFQNSSSTEPSKYQKLFTKKAWLKNYDEEDQARITEAASTLVSDNLKNQPELVKNTVDGSHSPMTNADTSHLSEVKTNGASKSGKLSKSGNKKKLKDVKTKKASSIASLRPSRLSNEGAENDSEGTTASTSDLDDTDETDSMKSSSDKRLRRMPRRKVKSNPERDSVDQPAKEIKAKITEDLTKRRGKKEKSSESNNLKRKYNSDDESANQKTKRIKDESATSTVSPKKRPGVEFLQRQSCYEIVPKGIRCLECRKVRQPSTKGDKTVPSKQALKSNWDAFCRFYDFRKLHFNKAGQIVVAGFCSASDATNFDKQLWLPNGDNPPANITYKVAKYILKNIGDEFCKLVQRERMVINAYESRSGDTRATWKRVVDGMRELCDVCNTTLFNCHFVCERCGFVICIDCHQSRSENHKDHQINEEIKKEPADSGDNSRDIPDLPATNNKKSKKDLSGWLFCTKNEEHRPDKLALAKIIAGDCLEEVWSLLHRVRRRLNFGPCSCEDSALTGSDTLTLENVPADQANIEIEQEDGEESSHSTLKGLLLAGGNIALNGCLTQDDKIKSAGLNRKITKLNDADKPFEFTNEGSDESDQVYAAIEGCIASLEVESQEPSLLDAIPQKNETHLRLCDGELLVLTQSRHKANTKLFRQYWRQGKPVLVRDIHKRMNIDMWIPQFFSGKFGEYRSDLVDCRNGDIHRQSMRKYWDGFEPNNTKRRSKDENVSSHITSGNSEESSVVAANHHGGSALWRLKDWPPGQDFMEILPEHYDDFMNNLPLSSYTTRTGRLNLACRLPDELLKPDLGPKMYSAYGTTKFPERGTTNLHLDISDAVNVMVYVGGANPFNQGSSEYAEIFEKTVHECHVDDLMKAQIREQKLIPGALWHIFRPADVHKMRTFLRRLSDESKITLNKKNDPIHDQTWYLDQVLLDRLYKEHGVKSYPVLQCMGDAILIPAGAPHQVKNLQNCIKVANDFVSPENVHHCLKLTDEFRNLPETHINQEDKLQIKNILYHSVKESIQYIDLYESGRIDATQESSDEDDCEEL